MSEARGAFRNKQLRIVSIVAGVLLFGGLVIYFSTPAEPTYQGKGLSWWIGRYHGGFSTLGPMSPRAIEDDTKLRIAVKAIGTNAIPTLLKWMQTPESPLKDKINVLLERQRIITLRLRTAEQKWNMADEGFYLLGNVGMPAVPALTRLLDSPSGTQELIAFDAILSIAHERNVLLPIIVQTLRKTNSLQISAAVYIADTHPDQAEKLGVYRLFPGLKSRKGSTFDPVVIPPPVKRNNRLILIVIGVLVLGVLLVLAWPSGPSYHGRSLEWWVKRYETLENSSGARDSRADLERVEHSVFISILVIARDTRVLPPTIVRSLQRKDNLRMRAAFFIQETHPEQAEALGGL